MDFIDLEGRDMVPDDTPVTVTFTGAEWAAVSAACVIAHDAFLNGVCDVFPVEMLTRLHDMGTCTSTLGRRIAVHCIAD